MRIVVAGGGLGGLATAVSIRQMVPAAEVAVLERDDGPGSEGRGYSITLDGEGLGALDRLGLHEEVRRTAQPVGSLRFLRPSGQRLLELAPAPADGTRATASVVRADLRDVLLRRLPEDAVRWGSLVTRYEPAERGVAVELEGGGTVEADLVVAAEGVRSRARAQLTGVGLNDLGITRVEGLASSLDDPFLSAGPTMTLGTGRSVFCQQVPGEGLIWSFAQKVAAGTLRAQQPADVLPTVAETLAEWHPPIPTAVGSTPADAVKVRGTHDVGPLDSFFSGRVVLLGDAAHAMSPYRGRGANMALRDAVDLGEALAETGSVEEVGPAYDRRALRRNRTAVLTSRRAATTLHASGLVGRLARDAGLRATDFILRMRS